MKVKNFPARKLQRKKRAGQEITDEQISAARAIKTKKGRVK